MVPGLVFATHLRHVLGCLKEPLFSKSSDCQGSLKGLMREQLAQRVVDSCEPFAPQSCSLRVPLTKDHHCPWVGNCASLAIQIGSDMTGPLADHERTDL